MLQKRNDFEIIEILRKDQSHIRDIALKLKMVPSTVMRTLNALQEENVVDFKKDGKNSTYFLKETPEANIYVYFSEKYKLLKLIEQPLMRRLIKELHTETKGELIVLFGSHAKNTYSSTSDIDIYIETSQPTQKEKLQKISPKLSIKLGNFDKDSPLGKEIKRNHIIVQNVERFCQLTQ
ncbi:nucleotidyltransferase domain-containing protein [Candidatus Woesearchaeota archaeon]|nr:nucleotidyltransferase domain-containing protein [Candidatus Woesearchaeota archaeon]